MQPRRVILHCGLHKTGTTALQQFLRVTAPGLRDLGVLVPRTGRLDEFGGGHHNIAWELTRDRRFDRTAGTVGELADEIAAFAGDAVLSSEDFESCLSAPAKLAPLLTHPKLIGHRFVILVYLRDQIGYAESLFLENTGHHCGEECLSVVHDILATGEVAVREWRFQFDFNRIQRALAATGAAVALRSYAAIASGGIVPDFLALLLPNQAIAADPSSGARAKERWTVLQALSMWYGNRVDRKLNPAELAAICLLAAQVPNAPLVLQPWLRRALSERFDSGNREFCRATGLPPADFDLAARTGAPAAGACFMDRVFSFESHIAIAALAGLMPGVEPGQVPDARSLSPTALTVIRGVAAAWRTEQPGRL